MRGLPLEPLTAARANNFLLAAVLLLFILTAFNSRYIVRIFGDFEEHVATESRTMLLLLLQTSVLEGIMLFCYFRLDEFNLSLEVAGMLCLAAVAFNLFSIIACRITGFIFTDSSLALQWSRGLLSTQALLGLLLIIPTVVALIRPEYSQVALVFAAVFYIFARLLYVIKGIRIFYTDLMSWFYFILYLCTLEIIPILVLFRIAAQVAMMY